jgi:hypothetical protein
MHVISAWDIRAERRWEERREVMIKDTVAVFLMSLSIDEECVRVCVTPECD